MMILLLLVKIFFSLEVPRKPSSFKSLANFVMFEGSNAFSAIKEK